MMNKMKYFMMAMLACLTLTAAAQEADEETAPVEWYLDEVINVAFVKECSFDYYYTPSASDMMQERARGEVSYFLNSPPGLNRKRVCSLIDGIMASQDDVMAMNDWQTTSTTSWKEFSRERNKFHVSVKNAALDDGTYYVSVTETANCYKHPAKQVEKKEKASPVTTKRAKRIHDRKHVVAPEKSEAANEDDDTTVDEQEPDEEAAVEQDSKREREQAKRLEQEKLREQARAEKEAEKLRKTEEKKAKQEQQALAREEQKKERQRQAEYNASKNHYTDVALWLSDKYDFTQTAGGENTITMYSIAVKDVEMAKLTIKNALKGSNARMAMPWRVNSQDGTTIETGYSVDGHVLVFAIGKNDAGNITLSITEMNNDEFEAFRQGGLL